MAATEMELLEARVAHVEEVLRDVERRLADLDRAPRVEPVVQSIDEDAPFDYTLIGKSVLIVGGAYLLRALTEMGWLPARAGVVLAFLYALGWMAIADRALARGRRMAAAFDAATAAMIAASLLWEATVRFHFFTPVVASVLIAIATLALLAVAERGKSRAIAFIASAMMTFTSIGLAVATAELVPPLLAVATVGVIALRFRSPVTPILAIASDFLALALIVMAALDRAPRTLAAIALLLLAALWVIAIELRPQWPESLQAAAALLVGAGGAMALSFDARTLAIAWSLAAVIAAAGGRRWQRFEWTLAAPFWALAATVAAFAAESRTMSLSIVGVLAIAAFALVSSDAHVARFTFLGIATLIALTFADAAIVHADAGVLAMRRSVTLAVVSIALALLGRIHSEAAILARVVLVLAGLKLLAEDFCVGRATTIVVALIAYGIAMITRSATPTSAGTRRRSRPETSTPISSP